MRTPPHRCPAPHATSPPALAPKRPDGHPRRDAVETTARTDPAGKEPAGATHPVVELPGPTKALAPPPGSTHTRCRHTVLGGGQMAAPFPSGINRYWSGSTPVVMKPGRQL